MKTNQYLRTAILMVIVVGGTFLFLPRGQALGVSATLTAAVATVLIGQLPAPKSFILRNGRRVAIAGWTLAALGMVLAFALAFGEPSDDLRMFPGFVVGVIGVALATLSRSLKTFEATKGEGATLPRDFSATDNVAAALQLLAQERTVLAYTVGPWFALYCLLPLVLLGLANWKPASKGQAELELLLLLCFLVLLICLPLISSIRWARYLARGEIPRLASIPIGPLWGLLWRLIFTGVLFRAASSSDSWLHSHLPDAPTWAVNLLSALAGLGVLVLASPWAMTFVMVAIGAKERSTTVALRTARSVGRRFYLGMLLILAPMTALSWLLTFVPHTPKGQGLTPSDYAQYGAWALTLFLTYVVATTYLTRIYVRSPAGEAELAADEAESTA